MCGASMRRPNGGLDKREFVSAGQDVLTDAKEELYTYGRKIPDSDLEKIEAMHEEEMLFLTETIGMTEGGDR